MKEQPMAYQHRSIPTSNAEEVYRKHMSQPNRTFSNPDLQQRLRRWLLEPLRAVPDQRAQLARIGASVWLSLLLFIFTFSALTVFFGSRLTEMPFSIPLGILSLLAAYSTTRLGYPQAGALLMIVVTMLNLGMVAAPDGELRYPTFLYYLAIPIVIAGIFLNAFGMLGVLAGALVEVVLIYQITGQTLQSLINEAPLAFLPVITFVMLAAVLHREQVAQARRKALETSEQRLLSLIENLPIMVDVIGADGTIQLWNKECERITGYSAAEVIGDPTIFERFYPDRDYREAMRQQYAPNPSYRGVVYRITCKDGSTRLIAWSVVDYTVPGLTWRRLSIGIDVTEQYQRERELAAIAAIATALRSVNTYAEMLPIILDQTFALLGVQGASLAVRRYTEAGEVIVVEASLGAWRHQIGATLKLERGLYAYVINNQQPYATADIYRDPIVANPQLLGGLTAAAAVPLIAQESVIGVIGIGRATPFSEEDMRVLIAICDIAANALQRAEMLELLEQHVHARTAELAAAYHKLEALDHLKAKLIADLSHELRTPISTLGVQMHLIEAAPTHPQVPDRLKVMKSQIERLNKLIEGVLDVLRFEMQRAEVKLTAQDIGLLVRQVAEKARQRITGAQQLTVKIAPHLPKVQGNLSLLVRALENVLDNALKYTPAGEITICAAQREDQIVITIQDTGIGIPPEDLFHVFERFYRGKAVGQSNMPGIGLGLSIAQAILELHGGTISIQSTPEVGSQVLICLPLSAVEMGAQ